MMSANMAENSISRPRASSGEGNIPSNGLRRGAVVS